MENETPSVSRQMRRERKKLLNYYRDKHPTFLTELQNNSASPAWIRDARWLELSWFELSTPDGAVQEVPMRRGSYDKPRKRGYDMLAERLKHRTWLQIAIKFDCEESTVRRQVESIARDCGLDLPRESPGPRRPLQNSDR